jgi:hypothetical protein
MVHVDKPTQWSNMEKELVAQHPVVVHAYIYRSISPHTTTDSEAAHTHNGWQRLRKWC